MLQFANKPDIAYDMCSTIAPNCGLEGAQFIAGEPNNYEVSNNYANEREPIYRPVINMETSTPNQYTLSVDGDGRRQYGHFGRNFQRNRSELLAAASRDVITDRPSWNENVYPITGQYSTSTDAGKVSFGGYFRLYKTIPRFYNV